MSELPKSVKPKGYQRPKARSTDNLKKGDLPAVDGQEIASLDLTDMERGVSISWLAMVFRMDKNTVKKRIAACEPCGKNLGYDVYALRQVAAYLVQPKVDIAQWIKTVRPSDLPSYLQAIFWDAALKRQKWEENAGDLWRTDVVLDVFGDLAMSIKSQVQLWVENLDRAQGISPDVRRLLTDQSDNLLASIHEILVEAPNKKKSTNMLAEIGEMIGEVKPAQPKDDPYEYV